MLTREFNVDKVGTAARGESHRSDLRAGMLAFSCMLSGYGKREWMTILVVGLLLAAASPLLWWPLAVICILVTAGLVSFFRDPTRLVPSERGVMVSPADGRISSIHEVEHFEPFGGPAVCVRIFLSLFNVHINRSPCHARVDSITHQAGKHLSALNPRAAGANEWNLIVLRHPARGHPVAAVRQVAGLLARTIVCGVESGQILQRGERIGMIKFGSTTELYIPKSARHCVKVQQGQRVAGGRTVLAELEPEASPPSQLRSASLTTLR